MELHSKRLLLRKITRDDAEAMFNNWASDPEVTKYLTWQAHKDIEVTKKVIIGWENENNPYRFGIELASEKKLIGMIDVRHYQNGIPTIGYALSRAYWGRGIMTEALQTVCEHLHNEGFDTVFIEAQKENTASVRVIEKCGFELVRTSERPVRNREGLYTIKSFTKRWSPAVKTVTVVSLSAGTIGEDFVKHEVAIGVERLENYGLKVKFSKHARMGIDYIKDHPEKRADDLIAAFEDKETDMILCAIGGDDTYRLLPYLFENDRLKKAVEKNKKIFLGFSDTTMNHFMLRNVGLDTFYGQSFLADICELSPDMLPYSRKYFSELINKGTIKEITPSELWYEERTDFSQKAVGTELVSHKNNGYELLQGPCEFSGKIFGGCIDSIYDMFQSGRYADSEFLCKKYGLFGDVDVWKDKILLLESSEERPSPEKYRDMLEKIKATGIFKVISGIIAAKPQDEVYYCEYKKALVDAVDDENLPILYNFNIGHGSPRCIVPFGKVAHVSVKEQKITFGD